ncbi:stromal membrane-associated protein 1-like isoform X1 [Mytilus californianus]|uniref:stromal membrane-associated protein 1-like isoform X1 n=1 Tax=Mytilus californianus TaxID=6549 RepID=UPI0022472360|nr:stromal membrane-associated protein 1-like isoform X1 [Mytilus californianus]
MSTRSEKERQKHLQEKYQATLANLLKDDDNKYCVDCDAKGPRWASWNLGIFLCIRCAGIHRNLGVHISKVKSVNLDSWTAEQVAMMMEVGNSRARAAYEAQVPDSFRRPQTDSALESFIRAKYEHKKYVAREWVVPKPTIPKELKGDTLEMDEKTERKKRPKQQSSIQIEAPKSSVPRSQPVEKKTQNTTPPPPTQPKQTSNTEDLLSLNTSPAKQPAAQSSDLLGDLVDIMGPSVSTSQNGSIQSSQPVDSGTQMQNGDLEASLFDDGAAKVQEKSTKDSILALYGPSSQPQQQPMYGVPGGTPYYNVSQSDMGYYNQYEAGGMYMPQQNMGMYGVQQQPMMNNQGGMPQQAMMNNPGGMPQQSMMANQGGVPQQSMMNNQYNQQSVPMQQNPNMYGMMGQQNMQPSMGMYNQQPQMATVQSMQYNQMQQQMNNMRLNSGNMIGQPVGATSNGGMGNWGVQGNSGHTLSTNLWQ